MDNRICAFMVGAVLSGLAQATDVYQGMCDASAAVALGNGHFVVADDENDVLRIYKRSRPDPVAEVDVIDHLHNRKASGKNDEADIEGAAVIGTRIYWITSHARKGKDGSVDPHRQRFFATEIVDAGSTPTVKPVPGGPYESLLADLVGDARFGVLAEAAQRKPEAPDGLNIEGLAATADGAVLIGFRNPLPQGRALVVPLRNPAEVIAGTAKPVFGDLIRLDLGGRGIRSFDRVGSDILIVAGPAGDAEASPVKPAFALFTWSGMPQQAPRFVAWPTDGDFRPVALFRDPDANDLVLLSDDGDAKVDGLDCKDKQVPPRKKSFRALSVPLPASPAQTPCSVDRSATFAGAKVVLARREGLDKAAAMGLFNAPLAVNTDGAPTSYHPDDFKGERLAINRIDNGIAITSTSGKKLTVAERIDVFDRWRHSGTWQVPTGFRINWQNVIAADHGRPCVLTQSNAGYFGSMTALKNGLPPAAAGECGVDDQLDQRVIPAIVLRGSSNPLRGWGASVGDLVLAVNPATGVTVPAVIGDTGDDTRIGEGSVALNRALLTGAPMPRTYPEALTLDTGSKRMVIAVLPGSRMFERVRPYSFENIAARVDAWAARNGYGSTQRLADTALACARPL